MKLLSSPGRCHRVWAQIPLAHPVELFARPTPSDLIDFPQDAQSSTWHPTPLLHSCLQCLVTSNKVVNRGFNVFKLLRARKREGIISWN